MMTDLAGKVAIITGASGFLASGVVPVFRAAGARLVLTGNKQRLYSSFPDLRDNHNHLCLSASDISIPSSVDELVKQALERFGRIDILVNIVGGWDAGKPVHQMHIDTWDTMLRVNAKTTFLMSRAVIPTMMEQGSGVIINIGARPGLRSGGNDAAYAAAKAALMRLTESMSEEYKRQGIRINAVLPAAIITPQRYAEDPHAGVTPQQLGKVIAFLASEDGQIIHGALIPAYGTRF